MVENCCDSNSARKLQLACILINQFDHIASVAFHSLAKNYHRNHIEMEVAQNLTHYSDYRTFQDLDYFLDSNYFSDYFIIDASDFINR